MNDVFELRDFFQCDPFREIYQNKSGDLVFYTAYTDYRDYLRSLDIIWQRLKDGSRAIIICHVQVNEILSLSAGQHTDESLSLEAEQYKMSITLQIDVETFILFIRRYLDKAAELIELLIVIPKGKGNESGEGFREHKKYFTKTEPGIHPTYSKLLEDKTYWFEQEVRLWRDKVFAHDKSMFTTIKVSPHTGIHFMKMTGYPPLQENDRKVLLKMQTDYQKCYPDFRISGNPYETMDSLLRDIRKHDIKLDDKDLTTLWKIVKKSGATIDLASLESIAGHVEAFTEEAARIFK